MADFIISYMTVISVKNKITAWMPKKIIQGGFYYEN